MTFSLIPLHSGPATVLPLELDAAVSAEREAIAAQTDFFASVACATGSALRLALAA